MAHPHQDFFSEQKNGIIFRGYKLEIFIPESYWSTKLIEQDGDRYDLFFIFQYKLYQTETTTQPQIGQFKHPVTLSTRPDEVRKEDLHLWKEKENFTIFTYYRNSFITLNRFTVRSAKALERYVQLMNDGKIRLSYLDMNEALNKGQKIHNVSLGIPQYIQQLSISEIFRSMEDYSIPARLVDVPVAQIDKHIRALNMRENSAFTSTLAGTSFEDVKAMLTVADNRDDKNDPAVSSKIEKVIRGIR